MIKAHWDLTDEELDSEEYRQEYADYYRDNIEKHTSHEFQHWIGLQEHTSLNCRFQITFYRTSDNGLGFIPSISLNGKVEAETFVEKVLKAPDSPSLGDSKILIKLNAAIAKAKEEE